MTVILAKRHCANVIELLFVLNLFLCYFYVSRFLKNKSPLAGHNNNKQDLNASVKSLDFDLGLEDSDLRTPT